MSCYKQNYQKEVYGQKNTVKSILAGKPSENYKAHFKIVIEVF